MHNNKNLSLLIKNAALTYHSISQTAFRHGKSLKLHKSLVYWSDSGPKMRQGALAAMERLRAGDARGH